MGLKMIYKNGEEQALTWSAANELVVNEGWSWTKDPAVAEKAVKKSAKPKKAKVEVEAEVLDNNTKEIDLGNIINNIEGE